MSDAQQIPVDDVGSYWPTPWSSEDGGSQRWCCAGGQPGLAISAGERLEVAAVRDAFATDMVIRRSDGELYALRHEMPLRGGAQSAPVRGWTEKLDPVTLEVVASTPKLPGGPYWPGGIGVHANGDIYMVFGCWAHRLSADLEVLASHRLPAPRPHNSFVILDGGELVTKDCDAPAGLAPGRSFGWDPVITESHVLWMDNGRNDTDATMRDCGSSPDPVRLWWARRDDASKLDSVEISGLPYGTESNPPAWDPVGGVVIAYDAGNAVLCAWRLVGDQMEPLWRRDNFAHAGHLILYPDTRELVVQDFRQPQFLRQPLLRRLLRAPMQLLAQSSLARRSMAFGNDQLVVLDLDSGVDKARVDVPSPCQGFLFPAPGFGRDVYYQSFTTIARVAVV